MVEFWVFVRFYDFERGKTVIGREAARQGKSCAKTGGNGVIYIVGAGRYRRGFGAVRVISGAKSEVGVAGAGGRREREPASLGENSGVKGGVAGIDRDRDWAINATGGTVRDGGRSARFVYGDPASVEGRGGIINESGGEGADAWCYWITNGGSSLELPDSKLGGLVGFKIFIGSIAEIENAELGAVIDGIGTSNESLYIGLVGDGLGTVRIVHTVHRGAVLKTVGNLALGGQ